jgi:hypothetical protein
MRISASTFLFAESDKMDTNWVSDVKSAADHTGNAAPYRPTR